MTKRIFTNLLTALFFLTLFSGLSISIDAQPKKAKKLVADADKLFKQKSYQAAIDKYAEAIVLAPDYANAHYWKAYAHYNLNQYDEALEELNAALSQGYNPPLDIYKLRWNLYYQKKDYDSALSDLQQAIKLDPSNGAYNRSLGDIYFGKEQWREALAAYKTAAQLNQADADVYYFMAFSHYSLRETPEQEIDALDALKRNTKYTGESYFLIGDALQKGGRMDEALQSYQKALDVKPDIYGVYVNLSDLYRSQNRFKDAIDTANKGLGLFPDDGNLYTSLSWYYSLADRPQEAVSAGLKAIKFAPKESMGYTNLCRAYNDTKQYQLAIQTCNEALKINSGDGETNFYLGRAYDFLNKPETATKYYDKAVEGLVEFTKNNPSYSDGYYLLGNAYFADRQREKAIEAYKICLNLSPRFAKARYNLGIIYFSAGNTAAARAQYEELKKIDPATAEKLKQAMEKK
ncbi:MAG TPA: tetratricopeptide repeat protein [Pyrinomonadaceae bacterium]